MNITKNKNQKLFRKRVFLILSLILILVLVGLAVFFLYPRGSNIKKQNQLQTNNIDKTSSVNESQATNTSKDETTLPQKGSTESSANSDSVNTGTADSDTPPEKPDLLRADYTGSVKVVATFQQASDGYCELQLSKSGSTTLTYRVNVVVGSSYYSCSFNIARSDIPSSGSWTATVIHHRGDLQTKSNNTVIEVS